MAANIKRWFLDDCLRARQPVAVHTRGQRDLRIDAAEREPALLSYGVMFAGKLRKYADVFMISTAAHCLVDWSIVPSPTGAEFTVAQLRARYAKLVPDAQWFGDISVGRTVSTAELQQVQTVAAAVVRAPRERHLSNGWRVIEGGRA